MGLSQHGEVHFLEGVPGWSWTPFFIDFVGPGEASGGHLRPPLGDFGDTLGARGVTLENFGSPWADFGSLEGHFGLFGGPPGGISPYGGHFVCVLGSLLAILRYSLIISQVLWVNSRVE